MAQFAIRESGDYIQVVCPTCGEVCDVNYLGLDPSVPLVRIECRLCKNSLDGKLDKAGSGFYKLTKDKE
jgi:formylmethanofuran dehydrogenase subunit B